MKDIRTVVAEAIVAAQTAGAKSYAEVGERDCCGFAWVEVFVERTNSKEAKELIAAGFKKDYKPKCLSMWNPSGLGTQSMTPKEVGAWAMAEVLREQLGLKAYAGSRMD
jgi:hypothetical protein